MFILLLTHLIPIVILEKIIRIKILRTRVIVGLSFVRYNSMRVPPLSLIYSTISLIYNIYLTRLKLTLTKLKLKMETTNPKLRIRKYFLSFNK